MKKLNMLTVVIAMAFILPACNTSWECTCVTNVTTSGMEEQSTKVSTIPGPKQHARNVCDTGTTSYSSSAYSYNTVCTLK